MDFTISAKMEDLLGRVRNFVREELYPLEPQLLSEGFGALLPPWHHACPARTGERR